MVGIHMIAMSLAALTPASAAAPARDDPGARTTLASPSPLASPMTTKPAKDTQRYCIVDTITGSRIAKRVCQTRQTWLDQGFDPLAPKK